VKIRFIFQIHPSILLSSNIQLQRSQMYITGAAWLYSYFSAEGRFRKWKSWWTTQHCCQLME